MLKWAQFKRNNNLTRTQKYVKSFFWSFVGGHEEACFYSPNECENNFPGTLFPLPTVSLTRPPDIVWQMTPHSFVNDMSDSQYIEPCFVAFADFCLIVISTMVDVKLPVWCQRMCNWEELASGTPLYINSIISRALIRGKCSKIIRKWSILSIYWSCF